ncbi:hypothetical protein HYDPIDRAFT_141800 [Hydnomerulius pinastri MD-312]|uniref:G domain-containing protein n=1 Tax=Hydnomerulius pinastri MD-312 TaxID=994086 RepID=A0A0C9VKL0_9AGAM|nr:hypothetical protein HYDPIDRAFT_141800 [Hydnomerulius pinastri MD-312]
MPNVVIYGESSVDKAAVINLIAGQKKAWTSSDILGRIFRHRRYEVTIEGTQYNLWDTAGLDDRNEGAVPLAQAENDLKEFIRQMASSGGISLLLYCIRPTRVRRALKWNHDIFYAAICRKKVPVVLVITGLEYQPVNMETWWVDNERVLAKHGMRFDAHVCATTLDTSHPTIQERLNRSQSSLRGLITTYCRLPPWRVDESLSALAWPMVDGILRSGLQLDRAAPRTVIVCDMAALGVELVPGITPSWKKFTGTIHDQQYKFIRVDTLTLQTTSKLESIGDLLIFYTAASSDTGIAAEDVKALQSFYAIAGGQLCPLIVVVRGCDSQQAAERCWSDVVAYHGDIKAIPTFVPGSHGPNAAPEKYLMEMVGRYCLDQVEVRSPKLPKALKAGRHLFAEANTGMRSLFARNHQESFCLVSETDFSSHKDIKQAAR